MEYLSTYSTLNQQIHFDTKRINKYFGSDETAKKEILLIVIKDVKSSLNKIENYIYTQNIGQISHLAHNLYGTCATIGLVELSKIARLIEQETQFNEFVLKKLVKKLKSEIVLVTDIVNNYISNSSL